MKERFLRADPAHVSISVYDGATGEAHFNRPELRGSLRVEPGTALPGDDYPLDLPAENNGSATPQAITSCGGSPSPGCTSGAGPYRRVVTRPVAAEVTCPSGVPRPCSGTDGTNTGYFNAGTVTTGCTVGTFAPRGGGVSDVGYVFLGGYSASPHETGGTVDAGLQNNDVLFLDHPKRDDYSLFLGILDVAKLVFSGNAPEDPEPETIDCGGKTTMEFRVAPWELNLDSRSGSGCVSSKTVDNPWQLAACGTVAFIIERGTGGVGQQYNEQAIVWIAPSISYGGWGKMATSEQGSTEKPQKNYWPQASCGGCIFKWTTGIGQLKEDLTDNSSYTATWSNRKIAPWATDPGDKSFVNLGVPVPMTEKLTLCSEYPLWTAYDGATAESDCSDTSPTVSGLRRSVQVSNYSVEGETDFISLSF
jgi:hypothetical protein